MKGEHLDIVLTATVSKTWFEKGLQRSDLTLGVYIEASMDSSKKAMV